VEVTAESIYEAAALGASALKSDGWADAIAPGSELEVQVREPANVSSAHGAADSSLVRWRCSQPGRDAEEATIKTNCSLKRVRRIEAAVAYSGHGEWC
jgi:hypothetical protein